MDRGFERGFPPSNFGIPPIHSYPGQMRYPGHPTYPPANLTSHFPFPIPPHMAPQAAAYNRFHHNVPSGPAWHPTLPESGMWGASPFGIPPTMSHLTDNALHSPLTTPHQANNFNTSATTQEKQPAWLNVLSSCHKSDTPSSPAREPKLGSATLHVEAEEDDDVLVDDFDGQCCRTYPYNHRKILSWRKRKNAAAAATSGTKDLRTTNDSSSGTEKSPRVPTASSSASIPVGIAIGRQRQHISNFAPSNGRLTCSATASAAGQDGKLISHHHALPPPMEFSRPWPWNLTPNPSPYLWPMASTGPIPMGYQLAKDPLTGQILLIPTDTHNWASRSHSSQPLLPFGDHRLHQPLTSPQQQRSLPLPNIEEVGERAADRKESKKSNSFSAASLISSRPNDGNLPNGPDRALSSPSPKIEPQVPPESEEAEKPPEAAAAANIPPDPVDPVVEDKTVGVEREEDERDEVEMQTNEAGRPETDECVSTLLELATAKPTHDGLWVLLRGIDLSAKIIISKPEDKFPNSIELLCRATFSDCFNFGVKSLADDLTLESLCQVTSLEYAELVDETPDSLALYRQKVNLHSYQSETSAQTIKSFIESRSTRKAANCSEEMQDEPNYMGIKCLAKIINQIKNVEFMSQTEIELRAALAELQQQYRTRHKNLAKSKSILKSEKSKVSNASAGKSPGRPKKRRHQGSSNEETVAKKVRGQQQQQLNTPEKHHFTEDDDSAPPVLLPAYASPCEGRTEMSKSGLLKPPKLTASSLSPMQERKRAANCVTNLSTISARFMKGKASPFANLMKQFTGGQEDERDIFCDEFQEDEDNKPKPSASPDKKQNDGKKRRKSLSNESGTSKKRKCDKPKKHSGVTETTETIVPKKPKSLFMINHFNVSETLEHAPENSDPKLRATLREEDLTSGRKILILQEGRFWPATVSTTTLEGVYSVLVEKTRNNKAVIMARDDLLAECILEAQPTAKDQIPVGTRVCVYWSQIYNCLFPGTVEEMDPDVAQGKNKEMLIQVLLDDGDRREVNISNVRMLPCNYSHVVYDPDPISSLRRRRISNDSVDNANAAPALPIALGQEQPAKRMNPSSGKSLSWSAPDGEKSEHHAEKKRKHKKKCSHRHHCHKRHHCSKHKNKKKRNPFPILDEALEEEEEEDAADKSDEDNDNLRVKLDGSFNNTTTYSIRSPRTAGVFGAAVQAVGHPLNPTIDSRESESTTSSETEEYETINKVSGGKQKIKGRHVQRKKPGFNPVTGRPLWRWLDGDEGYRRPGSKGKLARKLFHRAIQRGEGEVISVGDCAVFLSSARVDRPYVGKIELLWETNAGPGEATGANSASSMMVRVKWFYHPEEIETNGDEFSLKYAGGLFQSSHTDVNDVQTIAHIARVLPMKEYLKATQTDKRKKMSANAFYLAGSYDPASLSVIFEQGVIK